MWYECITLLGLETSASSEVPAMRNHQDAQGHFMARALPRIAETTQFGGETQPDLRASGSNEGVPS